MSLFKQTESEKMKTQGVIAIKPIFEEEREFLNRRLGIELSKGCWKKGVKIYLDPICEKPIYTFKVTDGDMTLVKDNTKMFENYTQKSLKELIEINNSNLDELRKKSVDKTVQYILDNQDQDLFVVSHSSGKDSVVLFDIWNRALGVIERTYPEVKINWEINFSNTSNETADTYKFIKNELPKDKLNILNPKIGYYQWISKVKNYFVPSIFARNCCSTYKEGQITKHYDKNQTITMLTGVRKFESTKRAKYDYIMNHEFRKKLFGTSNLPEKWTTLAPIVEWHNEDIWMYILREELKFNEIYKFGFYRAGCIVCPFQHDYIDLLIEEHYPTVWERWVEVLKKNYEIYGIKDRLKWSFEEYKNGKWKTGVSKIYEITKLKATEERIEEVSGLLGVSKDVAEKYFKRKCGKCDKNLNPTEIGMFLKLYGRYEDQVDNREYLCRNHMCEDLEMNTKEYNEMYQNFRDGGCDLF